MTILNVLSVYVLLRKKLGKTVAILGDLQGPKIRVSTFKDGKIFLKHW